MRFRLLHKPRHNSIPTHGVIVERLLATDTVKSAKKKIKFLYKFYFFYNPILLKLTLK